MKLRTRDGLILVVAVLAIIGAYLDGDGRWLHWLAKPATTLLSPRSPGRRGRRAMRSTGVRCWPACCCPVQVISR